MMRIKAFAIGDINRASSRLRSYYLLDNCGRDDIVIDRRKGYVSGFRSDMIHIQKVASLKLLLFVLLYRFCGKIVVFDLDDQHDRKNGFLGFSLFVYYVLMMRFASFVTVDTIGRKKYWERYVDKDKIAIIEDVADMPPGMAPVKDRWISADDKTLLWVGYVDNINSIFDIVEVLKSNDEYRLTVVTNCSECPSWLRISNVDFVEWKRDIMFDKSIRAKFVILSHDVGDDAVFMKSDNKMVLSLLSGYVPLVSRSPAYERLAKRIQSEFLLYDNQTEVLSALQKINDMDLHGFFVFSHDFIVREYSARFLFDKLIDKVSAFCKRT